MLSSFFLDIDFIYLKKQIYCRSDIARTEYLSNPDERLRWQANALPADDLCTENAIMLKVSLVSIIMK